MCGTLRGTLCAIGPLMDQTLLGTFINDVRYTGRWEVINGCFPLNSHLYFSKHELQRNSIVWHPSCTSSVLENMHRQVEVSCVEVEVVCKLQINKGLKLCEVYATQPKIIRNSHSGIFMIFVF